MRALLAHGVRTQRKDQVRALSFLFRDCCPVALIRESTQSGRTAFDVSHQSCRRELEALLITARRRRRQRLGWLAFWWD